MATVIVGLPVNPSASAAVPVVSWFSVATRAAATVPEAILEPLNAVIFAPPPTKFAAVTIPEYVALPFVAIVAAEPTFNPP